MMQKIGMRPLTASCTADDDYGGRAGGRVGRPSARRAAGALADEREAATRVLKNGRTTDRDRDLWQSSAAAVV